MASVDRAKSAVGDGAKYRPWLVWAIAWPIGVVMCLAWFNFVVGLVFTIGLAVYEYSRWRISRRERP